MNDPELPPRPDPSTGLPRPPAAPLDNSWGSSHRRPTDRTAQAPDPPPGQGPALEWIQKTWKTFRQASITCLVLLVAVLTLKDWGIGWVTVWWLWFLVIVLSGLAGLAIWSSDAMEAGASWFRHGKSWVKTYELTEIKLEKAWGADNLELRDAEDRVISIKITDIQDNPDLWNLVYNGILHSVIQGGATTNQRARERLHLDQNDRLSSTDDPA
jgi:hypothetical protein